MGGSGDGIGGMRIIYFYIDCLRPDHLGCYGYTRPTSPAIDAIARQGTHFEPVELYDMERDPQQTRNIAAEAPEVVRDCSDRLLSWAEDQMHKNHWVSDPLGEILRERGGVQRG